MLLHIGWGDVHAQGVFESNTSNGNWNSSGSWTLISGSDGNGIPDSDDDVTILAGDRINIRGNRNCDDLEIIGRLHYSRNRRLRVNGNLTMSGTEARVTGNNNNRRLEVFGSFSVPIGSDVEIRGQRVTVDGTTTLDGILNFTNTTGIKTFQTVIINSSGTWNNTSTEDFTITGDLTNNGTFNGCSSTTGCDYEFTNSAGTISGSNAISISDVVINGSASYTNLSSLTVTDRITGTGALINGINATLNTSGGTFDITDFTASAIGNTVIFSRAGDQQMPTTTDTDNNYHSVIISTTAAGNDVTLTGNITIDNQLTLTTGDLFLSTNRLTIVEGAMISGGNSSSYIGINSSGVLRQNYTAAGATLSFPIGDSNDYSPIGAFTINSGTFGSGAYVEFDVTDGNHPNRNTSNIGSGGDDEGTSATDRISRYWTLTGNNISNVNYDVSYQYIDGDVIGTESNMVGALYRTPPGFGFNDWYVLGTVDATSNMVSITAGDAFGDLYAMDNTLDRLPVTLVSFSATIENEEVVLRWTTSSEQNNDFYSVERSVDGKLFLSILHLSGVGNSSELHNYKAIDRSPLDGRSFYRLKQTDFNGQFEYSEIASILLDAAQEKTEIISYPNPIQRGDELTIKWYEKTLDKELVKATLIDLKGNVVQKELNGTLYKGMIKFKISSTLHEGIYFLKFIKNERQLLERILVK